MQLSRFKRTSKDETYVKGSNYHRKLFLQDLSAWLVSQTSVKIVEIHRQRQYLQNYVPSFEIMNDIFTNLESI